MVQFKVVGPRSSSAKEILTFYPYLKGKRTRREVAMEKYMVFVNRNRGLGETLGEVVGRPGSRRMCSKQQGTIPNIK